MGVREKFMPNVESIVSLYLEFDYTLKKHKKKLALLNNLLSVSILGLDFFSRSKRYRALCDVFSSGGEVVKMG